MSKDWIVSRIYLSTDAKKYGVDRVQYPYFVIGTYGPECGDVGREFAWHLPKSSLENPRYDLTQLTIDERPAAPVEREQTVEEN